MGTRWTRVAALLGVLFALLLLAGFLIGGGSPGTDASAARVAHWYLHHKGRMGGGALFISLAVVAGVFFFGYLRAVFRRTPGAEWLSTIFFGGAILFGAGGVVVAGVDATLADHPAALSAASLQTLNTLQSDLGWPLASVGLAVLYLSAALIIIRTRPLPLWIGWVSVVFGLLGASLFLSFIALFGTVLWAAVVGVLLAIRNPDLDPLSAAPTGAPPTVSEVSAPV